MSGVPRARSKVTPMRITQAETSPMNAPARVALVALVAFTASGCGVRGKTQDEGKTALTAEERAKIRDRMMARENGPFSKHDVSLLGGKITGSVEANSKPRIECKKDEDGDEFCVIELDLGKDQDGDDNGIWCNITTAFAPFGPAIKEIIGPVQLVETPDLQVKPVTEGISASFVAETVQEDETTVRLGTAKVATMHARGYRTVCWDNMAGGRKTFQRIVGEFFDSLKADPSFNSEVTFAFGYQVRKGDRTIGFRYGYMSKRPNDEPGDIEMATTFRLQSDEKSWTIFDTGTFVLRDGEGTLESMRNLHWLDGKGPLILTAKPSEEGRFRLKAEIGEKVNSLELTPKAPLNTERYAASELLKVSSGDEESYQYAFLQMESNDPALGYVTLTRSQPGVLLEEVETSPGKKSSPEGEVKTKDELHVDERGYVTKQVSTDSVVESIHTWGEPPSPPAKKKSSGSKRVVAKKKSR